MKEQYPLFTVIIPQKNRAEYLVHTLRTCMIQTYPNFEVIVSDDCSDDNSVEVANELAAIDPRIKVFAHKKHLGMRDNFEFALDQVRPGYVMALGGDDGLIPGCITRMFEIIRETGAELLTWRQAGFSYPMQERVISKLSIKRKQFDGVKMVKSADFLNRISRTFMYLVDECPMFYIKGVVSTGLIERVKSRTPDHCFYYCPTPDGFSGVVLAGEVEEYAYTCEPLSINGDTTKSQGRNYKRTDKESIKESQQFFKDSIRRTMHSELAGQPYSPLGTLMTADYLLTARDLPGWPGRFNMFSFADLIKKSFEFIANNSFEPQVLRRELRILREIAKQHGELELFDTLMKKTKRKVGRKDTIDGFFITKNVFVFNAAKLGINNIFDASLAVNFAYEACNCLKPNAVGRYVWRFIRTALGSVRYKKESLIQIDEQC